MTAELGPNSGYVEELYRLYLQDPKLVGETWARYFEKNPLTNGSAAAVNGAGTAITEQLQPEGDSREVDWSVEGGGQYGSPASLSGAQERVYRMVSAFRSRGHLKAKMNPLSQGIHPLPRADDTQVEFYHFSEQQLNSEFHCAGFGANKTMKLNDLIDELERVYCGSIGFEFTYLMSQEERLWLQDKIEKRFQEGFTLNQEQREHRLKKIVEAEAFEKELHTKYIGHKRFSLQGAETVIPMLDTLLEEAGVEGVKEVVIGMPHRGRLNVLANVLGKPLTEIFSEFEDQNVNSLVGSGDVKYHMGYESVYSTLHGQDLKLFLAPNPSHLEFVDPVVEGIVRAVQDVHYDRERMPVLPVLLHGDAAFAGQGVVFETLNFSAVDGYETGGTVHLIVNNQIGFTTTPDESRSSIYCTDMAKAVQAPVFHVNAEDVEASCFAMNLALDFRNRYGRDAIVDLYCYRKYGHNEGDDPSFTQPRMYEEIKNKEPISEIYLSELMSAGVVSEGKAEEFRKEYGEKFSKAQEEQDKQPKMGEACSVHGRLKDPSPETGVEHDRLMEIAQTLVEYPDGFTVHPKLKKILEKRVKSIQDGKEIEWGMAEAMAFGSLQYDKCAVRLSGQDCGRGTFSQRHLLLDDYEGGEPYLPLKSLEERGAASFEVVNSTLSEAAVVGFEFGYSTVEKRSLVLWEAQFGDFANGAQVAIDQFIASSEAKWGQRAGLTMLLPHGYEGQGPEHSSARLERFLQLCAEGNMFVCYPTSAAQYFHLLRRQGLLHLQRPVIIMTPKSLLRLSAACSSIEELTQGRFNTVLSERIGSTRKKKIPAIFTSGKIYYDLKKKLEEGKKSKETFQLCRVEQLYPFPDEEIKSALEGIDLTRAIWMQEEPKNMGAWSYVNAKFWNKLEIDLEYCGRQASASTATGSARRHQEEQAQIVKHALKLVSEG